MADSCEAAIIHRLPVRFVAVDCESWQIKLFCEQSQHMVVGEQMAFYQDALVQQDGFSSQFPQTVLKDPIYRDLDY